ncbi:MAG: class I tRNA ligase family protein, partial [Candidatus Levybacteria bacterium]|nr:class I tRNA ligase family protein [Candidatus Levybacteria bacterium]
EYVVNPVSKKKIPIWIADYVLMGYGTGAIMAVPAEDERDKEFAEKYNILIEKTSLNAKPEGKKTVNYHLRDWLISRQRYWGPPIPMVYCQSCADKGFSWFSTAEKKEHQVSSSKYQVLSKDEKILNTKYLIHNTDMAGWQPVPEDQLPVELPFIEDYKPLGTGAAPLASHPEFYKTTCPKCGGEAKRETDVSDTFLDSAWYFLRYVSSDVETTAFDLERVKKWLPVNMYIGGAEHSVLHLLYSRFITMALKDSGLISFEEPFTKFRAHGLIVKDGAKMSKSKGNVVIPDEYIKKFGADALRCYLMFTGPFSKGGDFRDSGIEGMFKFLNRVWNLVSSKEVLRDGKVDLYLQKLTEEITEEIKNLRYNTSISRLMMYYNFLIKKNVGGHQIYKSEIINFIKMIAPFAPHLADEMWEVLGQKSSVHIQIWPVIDKEKIKNSYGFTLAIQINGKTRATMDAKASLSKEEAEKLSRAMVEKYLKGKKVVKVIYVERRVVNFVAV